MFAGFHHGEEQYEVFLKMMKKEESKLQKKREKIKNMERSRIFKGVRQIRKENCVKTLNPTKLAQAMFSKWNDGSILEEGRFP